MLIYKQFITKFLRNTKYIQCSQNNFLKKQVYFAFEKSIHETQLNSRDTIIHKVNNETEFLGADLSAPNWLKIHLSHQQIFFFLVAKTNNHPSKNIPKVSDWVYSCGIGQDLYKIAPRILHLDAKVYSQVNDNVENF